MSSDGFVTQGVFFAAAMLYVFTEDALIKIEQARDDRGFEQVSVHLDIPSEDAKIYHEQFLAGELNISHLKSYCRCYSTLTRNLRDMRKQGMTVFVTPAWVN